MTASNHFVTGAAISTAVANPWLGIPLAILSHFILDALPHYGCKEFRADNLAEKKLYFTVLIIDTLLFLALIAFTIVNLNNFTFAAYGFAAFSPDLVWVYRYTFLAWIGKVNKPVGKIEHFHSWIQKSETPQGLLVEIPYFIIVGGSLLWIL